MNQQQWKQSERTGNIRMVISRWRGLWIPYLAPDYAAQELTDKPICGAASPSDLIRGG